jgi:two-component sensor histidine kinase
MRGKIWVRASVAASSLILTVEDNGIGLPEEKIKLRRTGSLGLELVHTLLRQLGAKVVIAREGGTKFDIRMPYATQ